MAHTCFHCSLPVLEPGRYTARLLGEERELCCAGCQAVASTIALAGLESYYATRTASAALPQLFSPEPCVSEDASEAALILDRVRCAACLWLIERQLARLPGMTRIEVNYATQRAHVGWDPQITSLAAVIRTIRAVGYDAYPYDPRTQEALAQREQRSALWRLFVAAFGAMQGMMYAFPAYIEPVSGDTMELMRWASLLLTIPVMLISCRPFFAGAASELRNRNLGLETPIALGLAGGFAASAWATFTGSGEVYFDSISMLAFLLLAARYAEGAARRRATRALDRLLVRPTGPVLRAGDAATVAPGERVPADGVVEQGVSSVDESLLTGESAPIVKMRGDSLVGGSVNLEQPLAMRVTHSGADTQAAAIARLVERAAAAKPRLVQSADRVARVLTFVVLAVALISGLATGNVWIAVAILVATCPCALGLASPVVLTRAGAELLNRGVLLTRSQALETLGKVTDVVMDKTGTLTSGSPVVTAVTLLGNESEEACKTYAASLEASSRHPVAKAFASYATVEVHDARNFPGEGIEACVAGRRMRIGTESFCRALCGIPARLLPEPKGGGVHLADEAGWLAAFALEDPLRPGIGEMVSFFAEKGFALHLLSGDRAEIVAAVARKAGISNFRPGTTPKDKFEYVAALQRSGKVIAMIGDGLNDAPVLARADVSFAMSSGADASQLHADLIVLSNRPASIVSAWQVAGRAMRLVRESLAWALAYNAAVLPCAALGWIGPWEAALGMGASSLLVLFNASRPLSPPKPWNRSTSSSRSPSLSYS
jgi:Cu2+-exporting ATPase